VHVAQVGTATLPDGINFFPVHRTSAASGSGSVRACISSIRSGDFASDDLSLQHAVQERAELPQDRHVQLGEGNLRLLNA
jgi:hypothetical protein